MEYHDLATREQISDLIRSRFVRIRAEKNLTCQQIADKMDITVQAINQIESGKRLPSMEVLTHFCQVTGVSLREFFDEGVEYPLLYKELLSCLNNLDSDDLSHIIAIVKRMGEKK